MSGAAAVRIEPWSEDDLALLGRINAPEMKEHLGGPETEEQVLARHRRYVNGDGFLGGQMYRIVALPEGEPAGNVGFWGRVWQDEPVYESGWRVLPSFQGRGIAIAAVREVVAAARRGDRRYLHAFPSVGNPASNAVCRKAGFVLMSECDFEYPPGHINRSNDWRLDLRA
ncbi:GNAT family N-acetyltransferase [Actinomadura roseirufa]|uniref:GNAT family N-acetyltransferase n=1 Tax=Actinomadura roseirufa TaxID=2094049 RepID=UPI001A954BF5|nr:GNAT family N-acetyltransferase [Actinomadura roseirufa]